MAGYVVAQITAVKDPAGFEEYRSKVEDTIRKYGGRFLVRGGEIRGSEGGWDPRLVIIEFESATRALEWYGSAEYRPLLELRQRSTETQAVIIEGV